MANDCPERVRLLDEFFAAARAALAASGSDPKLYGYLEKLRNARAAELAAARALAKHKHEHGC
jgi:hypothetical protein